MILNPHDAYTNCFKEKKMQKNYICLSFNEAVCGRRGRLDLFDICASLILICCCVLRLPGILAVNMIWT